MSVLNMIGSLLIGPLKLLFEVIFSVALRVIENPGLSIIVLSLAMNILVLPLYRRADAIQIEARDTENKLKDVVTHIKKTFSGDERMMILQTYYRQNNYNPMSVLSGSISLLLEVPFFMAAYQFLSGLDLFYGVSFGPITDLSAPDGLLTIGGLTLNLLPIIMTLVNVVSCSLYLKGFPLKTKIQLYGMAAFFLVFLYDSPSALVFYWTLNNLFSLVKTIFEKIKNSKTILNITLGVLGAGAIVAGLIMDGFWRSAFMILLGAAAQLPWLLSLVKDKLPRFHKEAQPAQPNKALFICGGLFLTALVGLLIPSTYVAASVQEYIDIYCFYEPVWYVVQTLCISAGAFLVWLGVFYWLANDKGKVLFERLVWILSGIMLVNYMFFGSKLGVLTPDLIYEKGLSFSKMEHLINIGAILVIAGAGYWLIKKFPKGISMVLLTAAIALTGMGIRNISTITKDTAATQLQANATTDELPSFSLSQEGNNVVVIMLDRGIGPFVPYIMEENPELAQQFDGFTYYANTLAYGGFTNLATPPLFGGYEYTPVNMNLKDDQLLVEKHNEAVKLLPTMFAQEGYAATTIDPTFAGYQWTPDLSIFDDIEGVTAYHADGRFNNVSGDMSRIEARQRNFFFFSLMKALPTSLQSLIYDGGTYRALPVSMDEDAMDGSSAFLDAYNVMANMDTMTNITKGSENNFMFISSDITHEPEMLQEPNYTPSNRVDNSAYHTAEGKVVTYGESTWVLDTDYMISHYHVNAAALMRLGEWFDYLRENDVYDNTRIIIVADHGRDLYQVAGQDSDMHDITFYQPMLLVKDFNATGFTVSEEFMTNADVPTIAVEGLIEDPVNPFTGNPINSDAKLDGKQYVTQSKVFKVSDNGGYQYVEAGWAAVSTDVRDINNWEFFDEPSVMPPDIED